MEAPHSPALAETGEATAATKNALRLVFFIMLMDVMGLYQPRNNAPLDEVAQLAGLPGKIGLSGGDVWREYLAGGIARIRDYCEADCANTYLLFLEGKADNPIPAFLKEYEGKPAGAPPASAPAAPAPEKPATAPPPATLP